MIEYTLTAKCDGCQAELASAAGFTLRCQMDEQVNDWREEWREQGFRLDKFRHTVVYCSDCSRGK